MLSPPAAPAPTPPGAPGREAIDAFCAEMRPWALRQAKRSYRHLPDAMREQAVDRAMQDLHAHAVQSAARRTLIAELADLLTESLRHVHVGWCLNESSALQRSDGPASVPAEAARYDLGGFVDEGLGGLERAVLQLEIGAGRDSRTTRAALRLGPRQYARHREQGLSKLRDAVSARVIGRACDQHVSTVVAAATGDRVAMDGLCAGPDRCRYCAREAQGLRGVLSERLAVAPWPLAIKPAGLLVAKLGVVGAVLGGKSAAGGSAAAVAGSTLGSGASAAATVLAVATLATGTAAVLDGGASPRERAAGHGAAVAQAQAPASERPRIVAAGNGTSPSPASKRDEMPQAFRTIAAATRKARSRRVWARKHSGGRPGRTPATPTGAGTPVLTAAPATAPASTAAGTTASPVKQTVDQATGQVRETVENVTSQLPPKVAQPVDDVVKNAQGAVEQVTKAVDGLLKPKRP